VASMIDDLIMFCHHSFLMKGLLQDQVSFATVLRFSLERLPVFSYGYR